MTQDTRPLIRVVAGILLNQDGDYLLSSRPEGKPYAGYWEFAGGKVEAGETDFQALQREFEEELDIRILAATPWLTKIHSYEHARVCLKFLWANPDQWTGEPQSREGQAWSWQKAGDFNVAPMLPANGPLLRALSVPRQLKGRLKTGLHGQNSTGEYRVAPYSLAEPHHANILISETELHKLGKLPQAQSVWVSIHTREQWQRVQDADVVVWQVNDDTSARQVLEILEQGVSVPLVVAASETLVSSYRDRWLSTGAHAVLSDNDTEVV